MATVETTIRKPIGKDHVQIDIGGKKVYPRSYKVPKDKADSFCASYKRQAKKLDFWTNTLFAGCIIASCVAIAPLTKKINTVLRIALGIALAVGSSTGCTMGMTKVMEKKHNELLKNFDSEEIFTDTQTMQDILKG